MRWQKSGRESPGSLATCWTYCDVSSPSHALPFLLQILHVLWTYDFCQCGQFPLTIIGLNPLIWVKVVPHNLIQGCNIGIHSYWWGRDPECTPGSPHPKYPCPAHIWAQTSQSICGMQRWGAKCSATNCHMTLAEHVLIFLAFKVYLWWRLGRMHRGIDVKQWQQWGCGRTTMVSGGGGGCQWY